MATETLPGECRMYYRADQQHLGHEINGVCGEPGEATLAAAGAMGMPAGCCACCAFWPHRVGGKSTGQERANPGLVLLWERVRRGYRHRGEGEEPWAGRTRCLWPELLSDPMGGVSAGLWLLRICTHFLQAGGGRLLPRLPSHGLWSGKVLPKT